jgi:hypothetical protein
VGHAGRRHPPGASRQRPLRRGAWQPEERAYQGRYEIGGKKIFYWDDTGFTADGVFVSDDELHHGGMIFRREKRG